VSVLFTSYLGEFILLSILININVQYLILDCIVTKEHSFVEREVLFKRSNHENHINVNDKEKSKLNSNKIFWTPVSTAWLSPCTVWSNNLTRKSFFLLVSSAASLLVHICSFICLWVLSAFDKIPASLPPIIHCSNSTNISMIGSSNRSFFDMIKICHNNELCLPVQRVCSESELPSDFFNFTVGPLGLSLLALSLLASACLQQLGNYHTMYKWSNWIFCFSPIVHFSMLQDYLRHPQASNNVDITLSQLSELTLKRIKLMFHQKDPLHGDTLLHSAIEGEQYEVLQNILYLVKNRLQQIIICNFNLI
jgi:hypothetical protein